MKQVISLTLMILAINICFAQEDNLQPSVVQEQEKTLTNPVNSDTWNPTWALGLKSSSITDLPGSVIVEKMFGYKNALRFLFDAGYEKYNYARDNWGGFISGGIVWLHELKVNKAHYIKPVSGLGAIFKHIRDNRSSHADYITNQVTLLVPLELTHYFKINVYNFGVGIETNLIMANFARNKYIYDLYESSSYHDSGNISLFSQPQFIFKYVF